MWWRSRSPRPSVELATPTPTTKQAMANPTGAKTAAAASTSERSLQYGTGVPIRRARVRSLTGTCRSALDLARRHIVAHCTDVSFPNGAVHGVRALGPQLPLGDGDPFRTLLENFTQEAWIEGRMFLEVPVHNEGHRHAMLKTLIEQECDLELEFRTGERTYRFRDYVESARMLHTYNLSVLPIDEQSWTLMAFARVTPPGAARWRNIYGQIVDLGRMIDDTSAALARDTQVIREARLEEGELPRDCPAFARACGGLHMLYALAAALSSGYETPKRSDEFAQHMRTHMRRFQYDLPIIDEVEGLNVHRVGPERARIRAFDARLKFLGHTFEVIGLIDQFALYEFSAEERQVLGAAREQLCELLRTSGSLPLARYRSAKDFFDSLVGDFCHAYNGLRTSLA
jgi:hypothetical protein